MPQRNIKGLTGLAASKVKDLAKSGAKSMNKWATSPPHKTVTEILGSNANEALPRSLTSMNKDLGGAAKAVVMGATDVHRAGLGVIKKAAQAAGRGAGRLAYGPIAKTPASVKPNVKRKK